MTNEYYGAASTPNEDFLAHYGVKGMKWGVRKARESGNSRQLGRQFAKASKKLAKLEKRAASGKKYAKRAALLGAGAAAAGGLAYAGTGGVQKAMHGLAKGTTRATQGLGSAAERLGSAMTARGIRGGGRLQALGRGAKLLGNTGARTLRTSGNAVNTWGRSTSLYDLATRGQRATETAKAAKTLADASKMGYKTPLLIAKNTKNKALNISPSSMKKGVSNNTIARIGAAGVGAGLLGAAGYNAYRAATTKRAAKKASQFRSEMNKAFAGTKYANQVSSAGYKPKQKRRRRG